MNNDTILIINGLIPLMILVSLSVQFYQSWRWSRLVHQLIDIEKGKRPKATFYGRVMWINLSPFGRYTVRLSIYKSFVVVIVQGRALVLKYSEIRNVEAQGNIFTVIEYKKAEKTKFLKLVMDDKFRIEKILKSIIT